MARDLVAEIEERTGVKKRNLRTYLAKIKSKHDLKDVQQAACFYIKRNGVNINV